MPRSLQISKSLSLLVLHQNEDIFECLSAWVNTTSVNRDNDFFLFLCSIVIVLFHEQRIMGLKWSRRSKRKLVQQHIEQPVTSFEDLSNDLIFEIFDCLTAEEIHLSFTCLNTRLSQLIETYPHKVDLQFHVQQANAIRSLAITRLHHLQTFLSFQPDQFRSLRSITVSNVMPEDVLRVLEYVPAEQLEYIYLGICPTYSNLSRQKSIRLAQTRILLLGQHQLRHCRFKEKFAVLMEDLPERLVTLQSCEFTSCLDFAVLSRILDRLPNLTSMKTSTLTSTEERLLPNSCTLTHLALRPHFNCSTDALTHFIQQCCPSLKQLTVEVYLFRSAPPGLLINKHQWVWIFPPRLRKFRWKSIVSPFVNPLRTERTPTRPCIREELGWTSKDGKEHVCQAILDAELLSVWENH